ncbi:predicted protein [Streptomyces albidoflavus]|nr:predicted protein [Streptomyces albidoflavus]
MRPGQQAEAAGPQPAERRPPVRAARAGRYDPVLAGRGGRPAADDQQHPAGLVRVGAHGPPGGEHGRLVQRILQGGDGVLPPRRRGPGGEGGEEFGRGAGDDRGTEQQARLGPGGLVVGVVVVADGAGPDGGARRVLAGQEGGDLPDEGQAFLRLGAVGAAEVDGEEQFQGRRADHPPGQGGEEPGEVGGGLLRCPLAGRGDQLHLAGTAQGEGEPLRFQRPDLELPQREGGGAGRGRPGEYREEGRAVGGAAVHGDLGRHGLVRAQDEARREEHVAVGVDGAGVRVDPGEEQGVIGRQGQGAQEPPHPDRAAGPALGRAALPVGGEAYGGVLDRHGPGAPQEFPARGGPQQDGRGPGRGAQALGEPGAYGLVERAPVHRREGADTARQLEAAQGGISVEGGHHGAPRGARRVARHGDSGAGDLHLGQVEPVGGAFEEGHLGAARQEGLDPGAVAGLLARSARRYVTVPGRGSPEDGGEAVVAVGLRAGGDECGGAQVPGVAGGPEGGLGGGQVAGGRGAEHRVAVQAYSADLTQFASRLRGRADRTPHVHAAALRPPWVSGPAAGFAGRPRPGPVPPFRAGPTRTTGCHHLAMNPLPRRSPPGGLPAGGLVSIAADQPGAGRARSGRIPAAAGSGRTGAGEVRPSSARRAGRAKTEETRASSGTGPCGAGQGGPQAPRDAVRPGEASSGAAPASPPCRSGGRCAGGRRSTRRSAPSPA